MEFIFQHLGVDHANNLLENYSFFIKILIKIKKIWKYFLQVGIKI